MRAVRLSPAALAVTLCSLYCALVVWRAGNVEELIRPHTAGPLGYDGQFTAWIAADPIGAERRIGNLCRHPTLGYAYDRALHRQIGQLFGCEQPAYRYQRILSAAIARLLSFGQIALIPYAILLTNLVMLGLGTAALAELLRMARASAWYSLVYGLFGGIFFAVRASTTEPLAYGLALIALLALQRRQFGWSAALFALAALAKEVTLLMAAGAALALLLSRQWRTGLLIGFSALTPFLAWQVILWTWLGSFGVGSGGAGATPFEIVPYNGIWRIFEFGVAPITVAFALIPIIFGMIPSLWALWRSGRDLLCGKWTLYSLLLFTNAAIIPFTPRSTFAEPFGLVRFLPGLVISLLLYAAHFKLRRPLRYSTMWLLFGVLFLA
ncbi:MAG: hypothetical protein RML95_05470 [Anaerolineae bacterium]|nr:hypothetical protein [Anaerolineae bacterium]MDW8298768.1 hypothetical protein [Anaerolineae bacterium]